MKKQVKKLALNRETLRTLEALRLEEANGGSIGDSVTCWNSCSTPRSLCATCRDCSVAFCF